MSLVEDVWGEWRISATELDCVRFSLVQAGSAPFRSSDAAIEWAVAHGIVGMMSETETGGKGRVGISKNSIREMLNPSQVGKSASREVHYAALAIGTELYRAKITFKRYKDPNVAGKAYAYHVTKIEVLTGNLVNAIEGTYPKANTPITNQEKASLVLMPNILLNGVVDVNGVPFVKEGT